MSWKKPDHETKKSIYIITISGILIVLFYLILGNLSAVGSALGTVGNVLMPFFIGVLIAVILLPLRRYAERKWLRNVKKHKRGLATAITTVIMLAVLVLFFAIVIPQLVSSISALAANFEGYMDSLSSWITSLDQINPDLTSALNSAASSLGDKVISWLTGAQGGLSTILEYSISVVRNILNFFIGIIIAVYLLLQEEKFKRQGRKFLYAVFPEKTGDWWVYVFRLTYKMFNRFISGKALDSLIVGIVCWVVTTLLGMPYAPLIGFIVGITNMIPVFGPFIGAIPCVLILLIIKPIMAVEFIVFIIILQQIDGNILGPHILGDSMGLPTLWIMFAIIVGGSLCGIVGMFLGVPVFAVIYTVVADVINQTLKKKEIDVETK
jgi:predicted PurR-regulated permease PerM